ncbi:hypothetical protein LWI28_006467 [Acer negundo]|uniref:Protein GAMETE EXPRESSED 1 n=1 Tax=Acer negundo TaxID=4023 RepID=A0AAD5IT84_ACENE|nr:hypothetical protein LWI28_006467 [Acer negundo]KAK4846931.1 hypothetical protein QYF36_023328 [Acer negundo]
MGRHNNLLFLLLILVCFSDSCMSWSWNPFAAGKAEEPPDDVWSVTGSGGDVDAQFSLEAFDNQKGIQLVEKAKQKMMLGSNSCWHTAYRQIFDACSEIISDDNEKRKRFAWDLSNCFQQNSARAPFPVCHTSTPMKKCLAKLNDNDYRVYLEFFLETNSICYQLQAAGFRRQTERLVNDLKRSANFAEDKLKDLDKKSDKLLQRSDGILSTLTVIDEQTQQVVESSKKVSDHISVVREHSEEIFNQSVQIAATQSELQNEQEKMKNKIEEGIATLHDSYNNLGQKMDNLKTETVEVEKKINEVGNAMSDKMSNLQSKANEIGDIAGVSLDKQKQLMDGQSKALEGLQSLTEFQSQAFTESRDTLKELAEFGHKQQEALIKRQEQLEEAHQRLVANSKTILAAQEAFEEKQASMFVALDKLFALHNALLFESRMIKAFFVYSISTFIVYVLTSTKQTYTVRPKLYLGLCAAFMLEFAIPRMLSNNIEQQLWIINFVRLLFLLLTSAQLLHAIYTYKDYEQLNHRMLVDMMEKLRNLRSNSKERDLCLEMDSSSSDSSVHWPSWITNDLLEEDDANNHQDPDYFLTEGTGENSLTTSSMAARKYNLRPRSRH